AQKKEWQRVTENAPWLTGTDRDAVAAYVCAVVEYARAVKTVRKEGQLFTTDRGNVIPHPALGVMNRQAIIIKNLSGELGLTPSPRASMGKVMAAAMLGGTPRPGSLAAYRAGKPQFPPGSILEFNARHPKWEDDPPPPPKPKVN